MKNILFNIITYPLWLTLGLLCLLFQLVWIVFNPKNYLDTGSALLEIIQALDKLNETDMTISQLQSYAEWREKVFK